MSNATTFEIPEFRLEDLNNRIVKLNKKATKLGTPKITLTRTGTERVVTVKQGGRLGALMGDTYSYNAVEVVVEGETPKLNGWEFLSVVLHKPAGNIFANLAATDVDLSNFVFTDKHCDHCRMNRVRNATFLIRHENGFIMQVGSTCLTDFTGVKSPQAHAAHIENVYTFFTNLLNDYTGGSVAGRTTRTFFLKEWMAFVNMTVREHGYISGRMSWDTGKERTAHVAKRAILAAYDEQGVTPSEADWKLAEQQINWIRSEAGRKVMDSLEGDFPTQMIAAVASDDASVTEHTMALTASLSAFYSRPAAAIGKPISDFVGNVGQRLTVNVTLKKIVEIEDRFSHNQNTKPLYMFADEAGNSIKWFASNWQDFAEGDTLTLTGTVKKHEDHVKFGKSTAMTRCKVVG